MKKRLVLASLTIFLEDNDGPIIAI